MSWEAVLKYDPLKENGQKILDYIYDIHIFWENMVDKMERADPQTQIVLSPHRKAILKLAEMSKEMTLLVKKITQEPILPEALLTLLEKPFWKNIHEPMSQFPTFFLEDVLGMDVPTFLDIEQMIKEVELFVDFRLR